MGEAAIVTATAVATAIAAALAKNGSPPTPAKPCDPTMAALIVEAVDWAAGHGMLVRGTENQFDHCPAALLPTIYPRAAYDGAVGLGPIMATMVDRVARDVKWLHSTLAAAGKGDDFTEELLKIARWMETQPGAQPLALGILRSDYMLHKPTASELDGSTPLGKLLSEQGGGQKQFMQVEINCIASSFGCMGHLASELHAFLLSRHPLASAAVSPELAAASKKAEAIENAQLGMAFGCAKNGNRQGLPRAIARAHKEYIARRGGEGGSVGEGNKQPAVVLFVVQEGENNAVDQRILEFVLWESHGVHVVRRSLTALHTLARLAPMAGAGSEEQLLMVDLGGAEGEREVSVVYFRAGYTPDDYPSANEWDARRLIERSWAVKCPSINYHLAGAKKVQQMLAMPGEVEKFLPKSDSIAVRRCFAGQFAVEGLALELAMNDPAAAEHFVLKPQREGGGNNFYGAQIPAKLREMGPEERNAYVLMQRIFPPPQHGILLRANTPHEASTVSELGIFSTFLGDGSSPELLNEVAGHMLRTKPSEADEGGVAAGFAVLDSPYLVD